MTGPDITTALAAHMAAGRAATHIAERIVKIRTGRDGQWRNDDVREAFIAILHRIEFTVVTRNVVVGTAPDTHNGRLWAYAAGDALRATARPGYTVTRTATHEFTLTLTGGPA